MDNSAIADNFSLLSKLLEIHGENSFKAKSYSIAAFTIEKLPVQLSALPQEKIFSIKGVGENIGTKILTQLKTGSLPVLDEYISKTPPGILEMLNVKGIGPKKIAVIWKELEIESVGELFYACNENRLALCKGFGEKTQQNILEAIEIYLNRQGRYLFAQIENYALETDTNLKNIFSQYQFESAGDFKCHFEVIEKLEWVSTVPANELKKFFIESNYEVIDDTATEIQFKGYENILLVFYHASKEKFHQTLFEKNCSAEFLEEWKSNYAFLKSYTSEEEIFEKAAVDFIPAFLRETKQIISKAQKHQLLPVIQPNEITAIIHSHSKWSDGLYTIAQMALAAKEKRLQYLLITDHSKSAVYANGLNEERIIAQHEEIDELNKTLKPFKIFKGIESDILYDGSLDYSDDILKTFDIIIASVHSGLKMKEDKSMTRLLKAIRNPYTNILGHPTGRLLLSRNGYPVDHKKIIDACAANNVAIELNANPRRLDIDWRWIDYCLEKNVLLSIDPDAHSTEAFAHVRYGVLAAQKGGLTKEHNLSSFPLEAFEKFVTAQHSKRPRF